MYRPPQGDIDSFIQHLENVFDNIDLDNIELFIMGDLNVDFLDKKDPKCKKLIELIKPLGLRQVIKNPFKTMILSILKYGDIIFTGTSLQNLNKIDRLFYRGLRICLNFNFTMSKDDVCDECHISTLKARSSLHLLLFMHRQKNCDNLLKISNVSTRLHQAPVFWYYKPNNERVRLNVSYRGALAWNNLPAKERNMEFKEFKNNEAKALLN